MSDFDFKAFVIGLPKEKLVELVLKFAPDSYREEVSNRNLDDSKAKMAFDRISKQIKNLFDDEEILYEPSDFEASLVSLSEKISGLWDRYPEETGFLFLLCFKKINEIQNEGLLYNSYYDDTLNGSDFLTIVQKFIVDLPFEQKIDFVTKLEVELNSLSYDTFYNYPDELNLIYKDSEIPFVKERFIQSVRNEDKPFLKHYYWFLRETLDLNERENVLMNIYHLDKSLCLELVEILERLQKSKVAIDYLEDLREANPNPGVFSEDLFDKLLQLKMSNGLSIKSDVTNGLQTYRSNTLLDKAIEYLPQEKLKWESIIKSVSHPYFYKYLISKNRIAEAFQLVVASSTLDDESIYQFYTHYGKQYPEETKKYFIERINIELPYTGDNHYQSIIDSLKFIRKVDKLKFKEIVDMLRREYKRRRNLMTKLDGL